MKQLQRRAAVLSILAVLLLLSTASLPVCAPSTGKLQGAPVSHAYRQVQFYSEKIYSSARRLATPYTVKGTIVAAVVPHHATASVLIASLFKTLAGRTYDTVIIVGPNHSAERGAVVTSSCDWLTPFGRLENDDAFTSTLKSSAVLHPAISAEGMQADHSVSYLFPFVKEYFPDSKIGAALIARTAEDAQVDALAETISTYAKGKNVLVIGSVDFSHYLMPKEAAECDKETIQAVEKDGEARLLSLSNSNLDSPQTLVTIMKYTKKRGIAPLTLLDHSSSDKVLGLPENAINPREGTTTYLIYAAVKKNDHGQ